MPGKINSVLARFEQTIQENEVAGGGGGMYLTNVASTRKTPVRLASRSRRGESAAGGSGSQRVNVSAGCYRNFLQSDAEGGGMAARRKRHEAGESDFVETDKDWDPFAEGDDQSESSFSEHSEVEWDEEEDGRRAAKGSSTRRPNRPSTSKRVGRLGNRKTRTSQSDPRARTRRISGQTKEENVEEEEQSEEGTIDNDEDDDDGSALNYPTGRSSRENSSRRGTRPSEKDGEHHHRTTNSSAPRRHHGSSSHQSRSTARRPSRR